MNERHTPGPWQAEVPYVHIKGGHCFAVASDTFLSFSELQANVCLMAVAPDMLAALTAIEKIMDGSQPKDYPGALMVARAAVAKARGEA
jgi:hypothetical protein